MLFFSRRFLPLFLTQFLGAFNDNLLKNALVMLVTFRIAAKTGANAQVLVTIAGAIFILPYFLFSATAGQLADKYDRAKLTRIIKIVEIGIMVCATIGFVSEYVWFLLFVLFCMGVHSTFFGPIKYALLPQHLLEGELLIGNAYIESGSFLGILLGTILGGVLVLESNGEMMVSVALLVIAVLGYAASRFIPVAHAPQPGLKVNFNIWKETRAIIGYSRENRRVYLCIMGISWFWLVGATFLSQFPAYVKDVLNAQADVVTLFLASFSLGIGVGSVWCNKLLRGEIHSRYVPIAMLGITFFGTDLYFASLAFSGGMHTVMAVAGQMGLKSYLMFPTGWRILVDLFMIAVCSGIYIVPLYTIMQHDSDPDKRARIIAANNVVNAIFMVGSAVATLGLFALGCTIPQVFLLMSGVNGLAALYTCKLLPDESKKWLRSLIGR